MRLSELIIVFLIASSCSTGITFNPDWYVADHFSGAIVSERGEYVYSYDEKYDEYACMHKSKIEELRILLLKARIPKKEKEAYSKMLPSFGDK